MSQLKAGVQVMAFPAPPKPRRNYAPLIVFVLIVLMLGLGGWYYFFGRKPRIVMSLSMGVAKESPEADGCWPVGQGQLFILSNGEARLVDIRERKPIWTTKLPAPQPVDERWQTAINARFIKLQQRSEELAERRTTLKTAQETKVFNEDVAKYQAEVIALRAEASRPPAPTNPGTADSNGVVAVVGKSTNAGEIALIENRLKRRKDRIAQFARQLETKRKAAKSELQHAAIKQEETKHQALLEEQKADEKTLKIAKGEVVEEEPAPEPEPEEDIHPQVACVGDVIWIVSGRRALGVDRASGGVKGSVRVAGPIRNVIAGSGVLHIVVSAGRGACQITKIATSVAPTSVYALAFPDESAIASNDGTGIMPNVPALRTTFGGGASLVRADIRLLEKSVVPQEGMKESSEQELTDTINNSTARSLDEMSAIAKLMANDAERARGETKVWIDRSTYEVTIRRPFDTTAPEWRDKLTGHVQIFSTANLTLITAGTKLIAFDRANKKLWEATLGAPVPIRQDDAAWSAVAPPCIEVGERLYFADGAFLGAFDIATGNALWRVPSVGIRKFQLDVDGYVYVLSDNLPAEALTYALDATTQDSQPLTLKINPADGKIMWQVEKYGDLWVSGNDVYTFRQFSTAMDEASAVFSNNGVSARVKIYKLSRSDGSAIWEWFQPRMPRNVNVEGKTVAMLFSGELQVIHSIAL